MRTQTNSQAHISSFNTQARMDTQSRTDIHTHVHTRTHALSRVLLGCIASGADRHKAIVQKIDLLILRTSFAVKVSDQLRELLVKGDESDNCDLFSDEEKSEFLFRVFQNLALGGSMNQFEVGHRWLLTFQHP